MTTVSYLMGPGTLTFGAQAASGQITNCRVVPSENIASTDAIPTLDGGELEAQEVASLSWKLEGTVVQDIASGQLTAYTWTNAGAEVAFVFIPNTVAARKVTGTVRIIPFQVGGDVKKKNTADFSMSCIGTPVLAAV